MKPKTKSRAALPVAIPLWSLEELIVMARRGGATDADQEEALNLAASAAGAADAGDTP